MNTTDRILKWLIAMAFRPLRPPCGGLWKPTRFDSKEIAAVQGSP